MGALLAVFIGGVVGTGARLELDALIPHSDSQFPLDTLLINIVGSFLLAVFVSRLWPISPAWLRAGLGPGLLGGFTTFSAVMVSMVTLAASSQVLLALVYALLSLALGFGAAALGFRIARRADAVPTIEADE
jgi:fluoride exporter